MRNRFFIACVAVIVFILMLCTIIGCNTTNESTDRLEKTIKEEESNNTANNSTTVINNYTDNSTTVNNNTVNNYNNDTEEEEERSDDDDYVVKVYVTEGRIVDDEESGEEEYREYKDYSDNNSSDNDCDNTITPIGDPKNDMDPDPNVVHIKNIKCPNCGAYSYIEHYNLKDENL